MEAFIVIAALVAILAVVWFVKRRALAAALKEAQSVRFFGIRRFDFLDDDGDGLVTAQDLCRLANSGRLNPVEKRMVDRLTADLAFIGHRLTDAKSVVPMLYIALDNTQFGASRDDFATYPDRLALRAAGGLRLLWS